MGFPDLRDGGVQLIRARVRGRGVYSGKRRLTFCLLASLVITCGPGGLFLVKLILLFARKDFPIGRRKGGWFDGAEIRPHHEVPDVEKEAREQKDATFAVLKALCAQRYHRGVEPVREVPRDVSNV